MKSEVVGRLHCVMIDLVQNVDQKFYERLRFTISELPYEFPRISRSVLY
jgi:hypothetical protein